ncbi:hypothetical protein C8R42DRAFT_643659 [Lentinula raphanica]|nr:hypothetical protein C8R42DRAFT_643659 [Lentinula raphanica]
MAPGYKSSPVESRVDYLEAAAELWAGRFPEDERGGRPAEHERTIQSNDAKLPQPHELGFWIIEYTMTWKNHAAERRALIIGGFSESHKKEQHQRLLSSIEDCLDQAIRVARGHIKDIDPSKCLSELEEAVTRWDIYHILPQNIFSSALLPLLPDPYRHFKSIPPPTIFSPMRWLYPLPGVDFEELDIMMEEIEECISNSEFLISSHYSGSHEGSEILAVARWCAEEDDDDEDKEDSNNDNRSDTEIVNEIISGVGTQTDDEINGAIDDETDGGISSGIDVESKELDDEELDDEDDNISRVEELLGAGSSQEETLYYDSSDIDSPSNTIFFESPERKYGAFSPDSNITNLPDASFNVELADL